MNLMLNIDKYYYYIMQHKVSFNLHSFTNQKDRSFVKKR